MASKDERAERLEADRERRREMRKVEQPADRPGFRPMPLALMDQMSVCGRCWSVVCRFHQEPHDLWHASVPPNPHQGALDVMGVPPPVLSLRDPASPPDDYDG